MRTLEQIKKARESGKRLWGFDLYMYILPMIQQPLSMPEISGHLKEDEGFEISANQLRVLKYRYADKVKLQPSPVSVPPARFLPPVPSPSDFAQKQETDINKISDDTPQERNPALDLEGEPLLKRATYFSKERQEKQRKKSDTNFFNTGSNS